MIGKSFSQLGQAMEGDGGNYNPGLNNAVIATGKSRLFFKLGLTEIEYFHHEMRFR